MRSTLVAKLAGLGLLVAPFAAVPAGTAAAEDGWMPASKDVLRSPPHTRNILEWVQLNRNQSGLAADSIDSRCGFRVDQASSNRRIARISMEDPSLCNWGEGTQFVLAFTTERPTTGAYWQAFGGAGTVGNGERYCQFGEKAGYSGLDAAAVRRLARQVKATGLCG